MKSRKHTRSPSQPGEMPRYNAAQLHSAVKESIDAAQEQIERARQLVEHSSDILRRIKESMVRSREIQQGIQGEPYKNPVIGND